MGFASTAVTVAYDAAGHRLLFTVGPETFSVDYDDFLEILHRGRSRPGLHPLVFNAAAKVALTTPVVDVTQPALVAAALTGKTFVLWG